LIEWFASKDIEKIEDAEFWAIWPIKLKPKLYPKTARAHLPPKKARAARSGVKQCANSGIPPPGVPPANRRHPETQ
jgi:hypothetical protein